MSIDEKVLELAATVVDLNGDQPPGQGHIAVDLARALLDAHEEIGRMRAVYEAAVRFYEALKDEDAECVDEHNALFGGCGIEGAVPRALAAIDAARGEGK